MDPFPKVGLYETLQLLVLEARPDDLSTQQGSTEEEELRHEGNLKLDKGQGPGPGKQPT